MFRAHGNNPAPPDGVNNNNLFPCAVVCSCGDRFVGADALSRYLSHTTDALSSPLQTSSIKPHRLKSTLVACTFCSQSIPIDRYRAHLAQCRADGERMAIRRYRLASRSGALPSFECRQCLDDDRFLHLDIGMALEHSHALDPDPTLELYVTCRECACRVVVDNAIVHAASAHCERLDSDMALADMFFTTGDEYRYNTSEMHPVPDFRDLDSKEKLSQEVDDSHIPDPVSDPSLPSSEYCRERRRNVAVCEKITPPIELRRHSKALKRPSPSDIADVHVSNDEPNATSPSLADQHSPADRRRKATLPPCSQPSQTGTLVSPQIAEERPHECDECGRKYAKRGFLQRHQRTHAGEWPFSCEDCGMRFISAHSVTSHNCTAASESTKRKRLPYKCDESGDGFSKLDGFQRHDTSHTAEKPFACGICGKCFQKRQVLKVHERIHTGDRPYPCSDCDKRFAQPYSLEKHRIVHMRGATANADESMKRIWRQYECDECGRINTSRAQLLIHQRSHTCERPFVCAECGKRFMERHKLKNHQIIHKGERPYDCSTCGKCFSRIAALRLHHRLHTGERPYVCPDCGKDFVQSSNLRTHRRTHHQNHY